MKGRENDLRTKYTDNKRLTVINMFGGAGCGKSTTAYFLTGLMKCDNRKVELIHEIAKDCVWERWNHMFGEQDWMFASQNHLLRRLISHDIDYAVVDSSILLSLFYLPDDFPQSFRTFVVDAFNTYDNINIFIDRNPDLPYVQAGRNQTLDEAKLIDDEIHQYFLDNKIPHYVVTAGESAASECLRIVQQHKKFQ